MMLGDLHPAAGFISAGDTSWQLTAGTLVGLMSIPALAALYGGLVQRKWVVNTMLMCFTAFSSVLVVWVFWAFSMGFGHPVGGHGFFGNFIGHPRPVTSAFSEEGRANIPLVSGAGLMPKFQFANASLIYFQFVFAAITPLLFLGSVLGRMSFKAWLIFVPAWTTFVYTVNAMLLWGGGWWAQRGAVDYSGGYVIHLAAGTTGFTAAAIIGPRLARDRRSAVPHSLPLVSIGAGILWLGWNGFNGGDPYFAGADAATAVLNTNLATAAALMTWLLWDLFGSKAKKPTFLGSVNGMIVGLVAITPAAGYVNGVGAFIIGIVASSVVWLSWTYLSQTRLMKRVDDAMGVFHTHGVAGLMGGLLVGLLADPHVTVYPGSGKSASVAVTGLFYGHPAQLLWQAGAAATVIVWDAGLTIIILKLIGRVVPLRMSDEELEVGDVAIHEEEAYPAERGFERTSMMLGESVGGSSGLATGTALLDPPRSADPPSPASRDASADGREQLS